MDVSHKTNIQRKCPECGGSLHVVGGAGHESRAKCGGCGYETSWAKMPKGHIQGESGMEKNFTDLLNEMEGGKAPSTLVENVGIGQDRADDIRSEEDLAAAFQQIAGQAAQDYPYVDASWIERIADQLRQGEGAAELAQMAAINRDQYAGSARIDVGGNFDTWDVIQHSLLALPTDAIPPAPAQLQ